MEKRLQGYRVTLQGPSSYSKFSGFVSSGEQEQ